MNYYIVKFNSKYKNFSVLNVGVLEQNEKETTVKFSNKIEKRPTCDVYTDFDYARIVARERTAVRRFKMENKDSKNQVVCAICGTKVDVAESTVDHIVPIKKFKEAYELNDIREDESVHRLCFDDSNFQIACKLCNSAKKSLSDSVNLMLDKKARTLNCLKKGKRANGKSRMVKNYNKVGSYVSNSKRHNRNAYDDFFAYEICKRDSRVIPLNLILNK